MSTVRQLRPWTDVVRPHPDVASGDLAMGTYAANLAAVAYVTGNAPSVYADAREFYASTFLTPAMRGVLADVSTVLCGGSGDRALQLRTPFGGGKTHTLLALLHLARARGEVSKVTDLDGIADPGTVRLAVISGEYLDPQRGRCVDGRTIKTLWGELAYQLGGWAAYDELVGDGDEGTPPGGERLAALLAGTPTLLLLDELLVYIAKGKGIRVADSTAGQQALLFVQSLSEAVNQQKNAVMVYSLQASVGEAVYEEGLLTALEHIAARVDARREPVSGDEVLKVVQKRLFEHAGDGAVREEVAAEYAQLLRDELLAQADTDGERRDAQAAADTLARRIEESYPFHPELIDLMYQRWGSLPSYQRTRGALQFLATVVHALWNPAGDGGVQALIGPGDVRLSDDAVRASFFEQVGEATQYAAVVEADFLSANAGTRAVDERIGRESPALRRLRVGSRVATVIALLSFGAREGEERGALEHDVIEASLVPGIDGNLVRAALNDLRREALLYLHHSGSRYRFETTPNLNKLITDEESKITPAEVMDQVRRVVERAIGSGGRPVAVWPIEPGQIADHVPEFVLAYLPPDVDTSSSSLAKYVLEAGGKPRAHRNGIGLVTPMAVAADAARAAARSVLAVESLLSRASRHQFSGEQKAELKERATDAAKTLATQASQLYDTVLLPTDVGADATVTFDTVDLSTVLAAGRTVGERVHDALAHHVFDSVTPARLVKLSRLGDRNVVPCPELVGGFFRYFAFTKLWSVAAIRAAIAKGVERGEFGYGVGVQIDGDQVRAENPSLIHVDAAIPADEVDLGDGAALLTIDIARGLVSTGGPDIDDSDASDGPGATTLPAGGSATSTTAAPVQEPSPSPGSTGATAGVSREVVLSIKTTGATLHDLQRALTGLRSLVGDMEIELTARATAETLEGIDKTRFQNAVRQHLEESGIDFTEEWPR
jgi:Protein of unknown function (DUF499)